MKNFINDLSQEKAVTLLRILYPAWAVIGMFSIMYVPGALIVANDSGATANNILEHELLFRMGIAGSLITQLLFIFAVLVLFKLFKHVSKSHALLMVVFALVAVPIAMLNTLNRIAALVLLKGSVYTESLGVEQTNALAMFFLELNTQGVFVATIFWGLWLFPLASLVIKSGYFPKIVGYFLVIAGLGYLLDSLTHFILPNYANYEAMIAPIVGLMTIGEVLFMLWVIFKGANLGQRETGGGESA